VPELADVEIYRQYLNSTALHQEIERTSIESSQILVGLSPQALARALQGSQLTATQRHGKYLFIALSSGSWLVIHFGITGLLKYCGTDEKRPEHTRLLLHFKNGSQLAYVAQRKLGRIALVDKPPTFIEVNKLGPDALTLSLTEFKKLAQGRRGTVKAWLMNQQVMTGIGNVYSDEILFQSCIHPKRAVNNLEQRSLKRLYHQMYKVFDAAIKARANPRQMPPGFLLPRRKEGGKCPRCSETVKRILVSGRNAWYCPGCQKED